MINNVLRLFLAFVCAWCVTLWASPSFAEKVVKIVAVDRILVEKSKRLMTLYQGQRVVKQYTVALGKQPIGQKVREGDNKTPEGVYFIISRNAQSKFYKSLWISYPNALDLKRAEAKGISPGGAIMIHGLPQDGSVIGKYHQKVDWTNGCIAVTNEEMDEIWNLVEDRTTVEIVP